MGQVWPGEAAWQAGLRSGDEILAIAGKKMKKFRDLNAAIQLGDIDPKKGVPLLVRRSGIDFPVNVKPEHSLGAFFIGVTGPSTTSLLPDRKTWLVPKLYPAYPGTAADQAKPQFEYGDKIVRIDDKPIDNDNFGQIESELARTADRSITVVVERTVLDTGGKPTGRAQRITTAVAPQRMRDLGLVMKMGPVAAVQRGSPAAEAGIKPGDWIAVPGGDPMSLPDRLARRAGQAMNMTVFRDWMGLPLPVVVPVRLREPIEALTVALQDPNGPVGVPALGCAYRVLNQIESVVPGSPAAKAGIQPGDILVKEATLVPPDKAVLENLQIDQSEVSVDLGATAHNWPAVMAVLQRLLPGTKVKLTYVRPPKKVAKADNAVKGPPVFDVDKLNPKITDPLEPIEARDWFDPDRGFQFEPKTFERKAESIGEAVRMGGRETLDLVTVVFRTVGR